jgi:hypothetical protein
MRLASACLAVAFFGLLSIRADAITKPAPPPSPPPPPEFSDRICPTATQPVREYDAQTRNPDTPVDAVISTADRIIEVYKLCGNELQANSVGSGPGSTLSTTTGVEGRHYAEVRQASYYVIVGRLQRLLGNVNTARDALDTALALVKDTIDWKSSRQSIFRSNNAAMGAGSSNSAKSYYSSYRDLAIKVSDAALAELALLPKSGGTATPTK